MMPDRYGPFSFQLVPAVLYGEGAASLAGRELRRLQVRRVLVVTDHGVVAAGVCAPVLRALAAEQICSELFADIATNPTDAHVEAALRAYGQAECDGVVGVGGGSAMDVAKCVALLASNGGPLAGYEDGRQAASHPHPPLLLIPTTAGTGSEVVAGAMIIDSGRQFKMHLVAVPAHVAICDPSLTMTLPPALTAATGVDALAHAIGAYVSVEAQPLTDAMALYAVETIARWLIPAIRNGRDPRARAHMMTASLAAGIAMKGGGSAEHAFAHAVNTLFGVHHGLGCAVFLAPIMELNLPARSHRYARLARALGVHADLDDPLTAGRAGIAAVQTLLREAGIPPLWSLRISGRDAPRIVQYVLQDRFHLDLNPVPLAAPDAERIVLQALAA